MLLTIVTGAKLGEYQVLTTDNYARPGPFALYSEEASPERIKELTDRLRCQVTTYKELTPVTSSLPEAPLTGMPPTIVESTSVTGKPPNTPQ